MSATDASRSSSPFSAPSDARPSPATAGRAAKGSTCDAARRPRATVSALDAMPSYVAVTSCAAEAPAVRVAVTATLAPRCTQRA